MKTQIMARVAFVAVFLCGSALQAEPVVLTQDVVQRYIATFPKYWKTVMELETASKMADGEKKDKKLQEVLSRRDNLLKANGWEDLSQFMEVDGRIVRAMIPLNLAGKFENAPEPDRQKAEETIAEQLQDYTPEEIEAVKKNLDRITKMRQAAVTGK